MGTSVLVATGCWRKRSGEGELESAWSGQGAVLSLVQIMHVIYTEELRHHRAAWCNLLLTKCGLYRPSRIREGGQLRVCPPGNPNLSFLFLDRLRTKFSTWGITTEIQRAAWHVCPLSCGGPRPHCFLYRETDKTSGRKYNTGQQLKIQYGARTQNIYIYIYKCRRILKILASHMMNHHMVAAEGRPIPCDALVFSTFASACIFCFGSILYCNSRSVGTKTHVVSTSLYRSDKLVQLYTRWFYLPGETWRFMGACSNFTIGVCDVQSGGRRPPLFVNNWSTDAG